MNYPLYLTREELATVTKALHATRHRTTASVKAELLLKVAEHSEAADEAQRAYNDLHRDNEVFELYTD